MTRTDFMACDDSPIVMTRKKTDPISFGRSTPELAHKLSLNRVNVPNSIIDLVLTDEKRHAARGISLSVETKKMNAPDNNTVVNEYLLLFASKEAAPVASITIEEIAVSNDTSKIKKITFAIVSIEKLRGSDNTKSTHILAAFVGELIGNRLQTLAAAMPPSTVLDIKLMLDTDQSERSISSYWEFEAAIERKIQPYALKSDGVKVKLSSSW